jgi:hypothetical protein
VDHAEAMKSPECMARVSASEQGWIPPYQRTHVLTQASELQMP